MMSESGPLGIHIFHAETHPDARGSFARLWCAEDFASYGLKFAPVQISLSRTTRAGTLRGLHWQSAPHAETKFLHVVRGRIFDVVASVTPASPRYFAREFGAGEGLLIPAGLAHGFIALTPDVELLYMMDRPFIPDASCGARYDDPALGIVWPQTPELVSERDLSWPNLR